MLEMVLTLVLSQAKPAQEPATANPKVDQGRVDQAIRKGCEWLESRPLGELTKVWERDARHNNPKAHCSHLELVILTLLHAGMFDRNQPPASELLDVMVNKDLGSTYSVSLQAMSLQKLDPKKYQWRIAECAHYLSASQCENGQWDYHFKSECKAFKPPAKPDDGPIVVTTESSDGSGKTAVHRLDKGPGKTVLTVSIPCRHKGPPFGDNSNSQYAALGIRAAMDAHVEVPKEVLIKAREWWEKQQSRDGGWDYGEKTEAGYGSMTVGGIGSLCIYKHFLKEDFKNNTEVLRGVDWLSRHFTVTENPKARESWQIENYYYYLYGMERAGILYGTERFGKHEWYPEGANLLLDAQKADGSWNGSITDACFAILFLKRGMKPLIQSTDARSRPR